MFFHRRGEVIAYGHDLNDGGAGFGQLQDVLGSLGGDVIEGEIDEGELQLLEGFNQLLQAFIPNVDAVQMKLPQLAASTRVRNHPQQGLEAPRAQILILQIQYLRHLILRQHRLPIRPPSLPPACLPYSSRSIPRGLWFLS